MDDQNRPPEDGQAPWTPASTGKRILAWVGVAYMVIIILLNFYGFLHQGDMIRGIAPLMLCPAVAGLGVFTVFRHRAGQGRGGLPACIFVVLLCAVAFVGGLVLGLPTLLGQLGG